MNARPDAGLLRRPAAASTLRAAETPRWIRTMARTLILIGGVAFVSATLLPWQQTAVGRGSVIAYAPADRQQSIDAPIAGRVVEWMVQEGQRVTAGQTIVELRDNDAELLDRILQEQAIVDGQLSAAIGKVAAAEAKVAAAMLAREAAVAGSESKVTASEQKVEAEREALSGAEANYTTASAQQERADKLTAEGLRSVQDAENARLRTETSRAKRNETSAKLASLEAEFAASLREVAKVRSEADGKVAAMQAELLVARNDEADYRAKRLAVETKLARQDTQHVVAPVDGFVVRVFGGQGGEQVRAGDSLITLVPDTTSRAVALQIDGNDIRFVRAGQPVRLVFEGWPALQASGWPSVSIGTWGGKIDVIDAADDGKGSFRVLVVPDPEDHPWPEGALLRQGVRTNGWVMLGNVRLGYEIWRRLNDFPPVVATAKAKDGEPEPVEKQKSGKGWWK